jgi:hypothetical protein
MLFSTMFGYSCRITVHGPSTVDFSGLSASSPQTSWTWLDRTKSFTSRRAPHALARESRL